MLVKQKKLFGIGIVFAISFLVVLLMIFTPLFDGKNGLQYADDSFNRLSKGSSYFIPKVSSAVDKFMGKQFSASINFDKAEDVELTAKLFLTAGAGADVINDSLSIRGDLGTVLKSVLNDADIMYINNGNAVSDKYGLDEKTVMKTWWTALSKIEKKMKKDRLVEEAKIISDVNKKAVEPAYNFYRIDGEKVVDHAGMLSGLLVFYVAYTMWWGFAIYYLFEGLGLSMKKAKVKKEA